MKRQSIKHLKKALKTIIHYCAEISVQAKMFRHSIKHENRF